MKVILLEDIENVGKKFDVKEVKDGHARNLLIPKGLVKIADKKAMEWLELQKEIIEQKADKDLESVEKVVAQMDGLEVMISVKIGDKGQLFEKIDPKDISEKLKEMGFQIKKDQIELENLIEELGEFPAKIKFEHNLEAEIKVIVSEEK